MVHSTIWLAIVIWRGTMAEFRVWHTSRDPYHCIFRMIRLLVAKDGQLSLEHLRILDMFLMFPSLLHRMSLTAELRTKLRSLAVKTEAENFVRLPGTASIWQDLQIYQLTAVKQLAGLGLLNREALLERRARLDVKQAPTNLLERAIEQNAATPALMGFLVDDLAALPLVGAEGLLRRAGLPSRGIAA